MSTLRPESSSGEAVVAFRAIAEAVPKSCLLVSLPNGQILASNTRGRALLGTLGVGDALTAAVERPEHLRTALKGFASSNTPTMARWRITTGEAPVDVRVAGARVRWSDKEVHPTVFLTFLPTQPDGFGLFGELTAQLDEIRREQHRLRKLNESLEEAVSERTREVEQKNRELDRLNASLNDFVSIVSHDLLGPTNRIHSFCTMLRERFEDKQLDDEDEQVLAYLDQSADRLRLLIKGAVRLSRLRVVEADWTDVALRPLVETVVADVRGLNPGVEVDVTYDELDVVHGDAGQIHQILANLIHNAVKFRVPQTAASIVVETSRLSDSRQVTLSVSDKGMGIHSGEVERVLRPFVRGSGTRGVAGDGLGLAMCQRICQQHGGTLWVERSTHMSVSDDSGTEVRLTLPAAK